MKIFLCAIYLSNILCTNSLRSSSIIISLEVSSVSPRSFTFGDLLDRRLQNGLIPHESHYVVVIVSVFVGFDATVCNYLSSLPLCFLFMYNICFSLINEMFVQKKGSRSFSLLLLLLFLYFFFVTPHPLGLILH